MTTDEHKFPPQELMMIPRWITADETKKPIPGTAAKDEEHWTNYDVAMLAVQEGKAAFMGLSFFGGVETAGYRLMAIDIDSCFDDEGRVRPWAQSIVDYFDTYTERSPSGNGLHIFIWVRVENADYPNTKHYIGALPAKGKEVAKAPQVQMIGGDCQGYVTVTGDMIEGVQDRIARVNELTWLRNAYPPGAGRQVDLSKVKLEESWKGGPKPELAAIAESIKASGDKAHRSLVGEWQEAGYDSASECYFALVHRVLKATNRDGELALEFLLSEHAEPWSSGGVLGCEDAKKYAIDFWVKARVKKATAVSEDERPEFGDPVNVDSIFGGAPKEAEEEEEAEEADDEPSAEDLGVLLPSAFRQLYGGGSTFMIKNLIPAQGVFQIWGAPKNGKSQVAMAIAAAVASGAEFCFGQRVFVTGPVLVLVGEDQHGVAHRTKAQEIASEVGFEHSGADIPLYLTKVPGNLSLKEGLELVHKQITAIEPVLVLLDTQIANAGAIDENDTKAMAQFMHTVELMSSYRGGRAVGLVHHTSKSGKGGPRGSSVQSGAVVADFQVIKAKGGPIRLIPRHAKNWQALGEFSLDVESIPVAEDMDGNEITGPAIDFRVHPSAKVMAQDVETEVPEPDGGGAPETVLIMFSMEHGRQQRPFIAEQLAKAGLLGAGTANALRYLEKKLVDAGKLSVDSNRSKTDGGVVYGPPE